MRSLIVIVGLGLVACSSGFDSGRAALEGETVPSTERAAVVWDPVRERAVLFGGSTDARTWVHDGQAWSVAATEGPSPRWGPAMTWDPEREAMVLFGGYQLPPFETRDVEYLDDTWLWNGTAWATLALPADQRPAARGGAEMTWDATLHGPLLFGGHDGRIAFSGSWVLTSSAGWATVPAP